MSWRRTAAERKAEWMIHAGEAGLHQTGKINKVLRTREKRVKDMDRRLKELTEKNRLLKRFLAESGSRILLKKLDNLSYDEFLKRDKVLRIGEGDILLVENPANHSRKTLELLKSRVSVIIFRSGNIRELKGIRDFVFLDGSKLKLDEEEDFALAEKGEIEKLKKDSNLLASLIEKYRESRKKGQ
jgi:predicted RNase H-like nuclease (RuvC/YqgF family)